MSVPDAARHAAERVALEECSGLGGSHRWTDIQAAIGRLQPGRLPGMLERGSPLASQLATGHEFASGTGLSPQTKEVRARPTRDCGRLCESELAQVHCVILQPLHQTTEDEQEEVVAVLREACGQ